MASEFAYKDGAAVGPGTVEMMEDMPKLAGLIEMFDIDGFNFQPNILLPLGEGCTAQLYSAAFVYFKGWHGPVWRERFAAFCVQAGMRAVLDASSWVGLAHRDDHLGTRIMTWSVGNAHTRTRGLLVWGTGATPGLGNIWPVPWRTVRPGSELCPKCGKGAGDCGVYCDSSAHWYNWTE